MSLDTKIVNPNEDLQIPEWINPDYFNAILKKDQPDYVRVLEFTPIAAIPPGENFTSVMVRICMKLEITDGSKKAKSYILKTMLDDDKGGKIMKEFNLFPKEQKMYEKYIPEFEALYREVGLDIQFAPKCLFVEHIDDRINIVFEDLGEKSFKNFDRLLGYDMAHMRRVLQKLAEFHAASAVWVERNGPMEKDYDVGFINPAQGQDFHQMSFDSRSKSYKKAMATWGLEEAEKYIDKFPNFEQFWKCGLKTLETDPNEFNVLNHGDFWSSNVMANYLSNGEIDEILLVDFQICKWGNPAADLLFFITISAAKDIRIKEFDHFVEIYYEHLVKCLKALKYKKRMPKLRELQMSMYKEENTFYAFFAVYNHLVVLLLPTDKDSNVHNLTRDDEIGDNFRTRAYTNPLFVEAMLDIFPFFHRRGLFNFEDF